MIFRHISLCFSDSQAATAPLATQACRRLHFGFRPNTLASYERMFQLFLAFLVVVDLSLPGISTMDVLAFMEYLTQSGMSPDNITNHITGIRSMSIVYGIDTTPFRDQRIPLFTKSLKVNRPLAPVVKILIDHTLLLQIVTVSAQLQFPLVYTALYLLAFFSILRISNILPHAAKNFDKTRHLCVEDVVFAFQRAVIVVNGQRLCRTG